MRTVSVGRVGVLRGLVTALVRSAGVVGGAMDVRAGVAAGRVAAGVDAPVWVAAGVVAVIRGRPVGGQEAGLPATGGPSPAGSQ